MLDLDGTRLHVLSDGVFKLDGGSMFGVVPRSMWEKLLPPDERHRVTLGLNVLLIQVGSGADRRNILVDTGMGTKWSPKFIDIYDLRPPQGRLLEALAGVGLSAEDIDTVIHTHLHLDHTGASTRVGEGGAVVPTFPRARYLVQEGEWLAATHPDVRSRPSYWAENFLPLRERGQLELLTGDAEVAPGVRTIVTPGHTAYHQSVLVQAGGRTVCYLGDIMPTTAHLQPNYTLGFDLYPLEVMKWRRTLAEQGIEENWVFVWEHDPTTPAGELYAEGSKLRVRRHEALCGAGT